MDNKVWRNQTQKDKICGLYDQGGHRQTDQKSLVDNREDERKDGNQVGG